MNAKDLILNEKEQQACDKFLNKLPKKYRYMPVKLIFSGETGIGISVTVEVGDRSKNITDYDVW